MEKQNPQLTTGKENPFVEWQSYVLRRSINIFALFATISSIVYFFLPITLGLKVIFISLHFLFVIIAFLNPPYKIRGGIFLGLIYLLAITTLIDTRNFGTACLFFLGWIIIAVKVFSPKQGWIITVVSVLTLGVFGWLFSAGVITPWFSRVTIASFIDWSMISINLSPFAISSILAMGHFQKAFNETFTIASTNMARFDEEKTKFTSQITEVANDLSLKTLGFNKVNAINERWIKIFEAISQVMNSISIIRSQGELMPRLVNSIAEWFGVNIVGIYLNDQENQYSTLVAESNPKGESPLGKNPRIKIGDEGLVGKVTLTGFPQISKQTRDPEKLLHSMDSPENFSEICFPLKVGGKVIGALDIRSSDSDFFQEEDVLLFSTLSNVIATAIDNAKMHDLTIRALNDAQALSRQYQQEGWTRLAADENIMGMRFSKEGISVLPTSAESTLATSGDSIEVPITLRGASIGTLLIRPPSGKHLTNEQMDIAKAVADRVALSAENARLFSDVSKRAEREKTVSQITTNIRSATDPDTMIQTAVNELKKFLGVEKIDIRAVSPSESEGNDRIKKP